MIKSRIETAVTPRVRAGPELLHTELIGLSGRARTCGLLIPNQALRQLSYGQERMIRAGVLQPFKTIEMAPELVAETGFEPVTFAL